jgi:hypothetical protein
MTERRAREDRVVGNWLDPKAAGLSVMRRPAGEIADHAGEALSAAKAARTKALLQV